MSPRKRLSPSSASMHSKRDCKPSKSDTEDSLLLQAPVPRQRFKEEQQLMQWLFWISVLSTMLAVVTIVMLEKRNFSRKLQSSVSHSHVLEAIPQGQDYLEPSFQAYSFDAPMCNALSEKHVSYTLVTQCSDNRLWMLEYHCQRWSGPISLAVYTNQTEKQIKHHLERMNCDSRRNSIQIYPASLEDYPINALRNLAFSSVTTSHAVYLDVDFWPSDDLEEILNMHRSFLAKSSQRALVLPAFSLKRQCSEWSECKNANIPAMPAIQQELFDGLVAKRILPFDWSNRGGHGSTRYKDWLRQERNQLVTIDCFASQRYEPYLVVRYCQDLPPFQEQFRGYGKNKVSWVMQVRRPGCVFAQIGKGFVVHYPHLDSPARQAWNGQTDTSGKQPSRMTRRPMDERVLMQTKRGINDKIFVEFKEWLNDFYPIDRVDQSDGSDKTPLCDDSSDDDAKLWVAHGRQML